MKKKPQKFKGKKPVARKPKAGTEKGEIQVIFFRKNPYGTQNEKR